MLFNNHTKSWFMKTESSARYPKGYGWVKQEEGTLYKGVDSRDAAFRQRRSLLAQQGYSDIKIKKFKLVEVEDK